MVNITGLSIELTSAGIKFSGCNINGTVWGEDGVTEIQNRQDVAAVVQVHNASAWDSLEKAIQDRRLAARVSAKNIPNWSTWTQADWTNYFDANLSDAQVDLVTSLATARVMMKRQNEVIKNLTKMVIALRDYNWSDLREK